ncbi:S-ribosylhomocysteine lyase [Clostridium sardiniense]|uniref:S-ribosylhomocysteine lyase n=1 Tax=Clostridium sardiniense TaxID=29369 RepID=A0ABS7L2Y1_CLOSR|nr:S-ribosylhomocysteine lyase [Clostridium sardiniense]MBY0757433.1 S-ribosylhomocysteine lyase [Clostridium sardiniense]MDQ0462137.1 S-ribosylhomocysteine lyase [Clostridium sardiniense]
MIKVESFELDHTKVKAPYVRKAGVKSGVKGDIVSKFDLRFVQPNKEILSDKGMHTLEHFLAGFMRERIDNIIDISPMGCKTGFYLISFGDLDVKEVIEALEYSLQKVLLQDEIPAANELQCGSASLHSLNLAKEHAKSVLDNGISDRFYI